MEYAIVDIETTGSYTGENSITEIAIIIHNGKCILEKFQSLINPNVFIPFHIQILTGINDEMVNQAPKFKEIAPIIYELLKNRIFVAHNVNFDYSFIVKELRLAGYEWKVPKLCTVRLARKIIPNMASYSLGKLCQNLNIPNNARHRAMGDAEATSILFEKLVKEDKENIILTTINKTKEQKLPIHINEKDILKLPETVGIYILKDELNNIIYTSQASNIKKSVISLLTSNNKSQKKQSILKETRSIDFLESGTELMSLLMECQQIQQSSPKYNKTLKRYEPKFALIQYIDQKGYIRLLIAPYNKTAHAIQYFERASDANELLLVLLHKYNLNSKLCTFISTKETIKRVIDYTKIIPVEEYNNKINDALKDVKSKRNSFLVIDHGRNLDEKSYIYIQDEELRAFGFVDINNQINNIEDIIKPAEICISNYYMTSLILQYAKRFPSKVKRIQSSCN